MSHFYADEQPLADPSPTGITFPDDSLYGSPDDPIDTTYGCHKPTLQPQIVTTRVEGQTGHHASWASAIPEVNPPSDSGPKETLLYPML